MKYVDCFKFLAGRRTDELVITSAGNSGQAWWAATRDSERSFYLDASMSLSTMFASGLAPALPQKRDRGVLGSAPAGPQAHMADGKGAGGGKGEFFVGGRTFKKKK